MRQDRVIKDRAQNILTSKKSVLRRWKEHFKELMHEEMRGKEG